MAAPAGVGFPEDSEPRVMLLPGRTCSMAGKKACGNQRADGSPSAERGKKAVKTKGIADMAVK